jgi:hypothetical protein
VTQRLIARSRRTPTVLMLPTPLEAFRPPKPPPGGADTIFPGAENKNYWHLATASGSISLLGSQTSTLYIGVTSNLFLRLIQHNEDALEGFTSACGCKRLLCLKVTETCVPASPGRNSVRRDVPVTFKCVPQQDGGRKAPNSMGRISTVGVLRLRAIKPASPDKSVRRRAQDDVFVRVLTKSIPPRLTLMELTS